MDDTEIEAVLSARGAAYGDWRELARVVQKLKSIARASPGWALMGEPQQEAIDCVFLKIGRLLNGNPRNLDTWRDAIGYLTLAINDLEKKL